MSRKRTRSCSEEKVFSNNIHIQPLNMSFCTEAPFGDDASTIRVREECDYTKKITVEMARLGQVNRPIRIYADGAFDMFHHGHMRHLMQAKNMFANVYLIVGVFSEATVRNKLQSLSVMEEDERCGAIQHCKYTDEVIKNAPWIITDKFLFDNKIDFVAHDDNSYVNGNRLEVYNRLKRRGMFLSTERTETVSTSNIVSRIVRDYDIYIRRNLARGYSAKELNISYLNEKKIRFQNKMHAIKDKSKQVLDTIGERKDDMLTKWEEKSRDMIDNFLLLFKKNNLRKIWNGSKERIIKAISPPSSRDPSPRRRKIEEHADEENGSKRRRLH